MKQWNITLDRAALQEDIRKVGVAFIIAGLVGTVLEHVPPLAALIAITGGSVLIISGALREGGLR